MLANVLLQIIILVHFPRSKINPQVRTVLIEHIFEAKMILKNINITINITLFSGLMTRKKGTGVISSRVNRAHGKKELEAQRRSLQRGKP